MPLQYPFSAVLGCEYDPASGAGFDDMGLALVLTAISPEIGGVLVRGEKGTAKSTTVRALGDVLPWISVHDGDRFSIDPDVLGAESPDGPFGFGHARVSRPVNLVELPVGATEDRVLGSLHLEKALTTGAVEFEPGLLARAHRGVLYVDEVNLLHDHLVDLLLDAAATGQVSIERDGVSLRHAARFILIGTMNPEEGELRPQLLDRFGLTVEVAAPRDPAARVEVVRRRLAYDRDPAGFIATHESVEQALTERIAASRVALEGVILGDAALLKVAEVCAGFEVDGLRADIVTARTAVAHAAWAGRTYVTRADIRAAALLALPHRRRRNPFDAPGLDEELLDRLLGGEDLPEPPPPPPPGEGQPDDPNDLSSDETELAPGQDEPATAELATEGLTGDGSSDESPATEASEDQPGLSTPAGETPAPLPGAGSVDQAQSTFRPRLLTVDGVGQGSPGRRSRARNGTGRRVGSGTGAGSIHLVATLMAAAERHAAHGTSTEGGRVRLEGADLRSAIREGRESNLLVFCVDASGSMAARRRMIQVKTAVLSLLTDAYRRRDRVALISFRGQGAELSLPPTGSTEIAAALLDDLAAGGRTPLAEGLVEAEHVLRREQLRDARTRPLLIVLTDGRATHGVDAVERSRQAAGVLARRRVPTVVIDCEQGPLRFGLARILAMYLSAEHVPMEQVDAARLVDAVAGRVA